MTQQTATQAANLNEKMTAWQTPANAQNLLSEMQALFRLMPGAVLTHDGPLPSDDEVEAMFDNMPV